MAIGIALFLAIAAVAVLGYLLAGWPIDDAVYMVVITVFGVGYGEVRPVSSLPLRGLTVVLIVAGYSAVIYIVGGFIQMVVDGELNKALGARRMTKQIDQLTGHTIICGFGRMGTALARELFAADEPFVAIDTLGGTSLLADDAGYLVINGDATEEEILEMAGIRRARTLATVMSDDATNVFVTVTAREMNPELTIVARAENRRTESKLRSCGADTVVTPTAIGATMISELITRPSVEELLDRLSAGPDVGIDLIHFGIRFDEVEIGPNSPLAYRTLGEVEARGTHGYLIVGIRNADGSAVMHPPITTPLQVGDALVVLGFNDDIPELVERRSNGPTRLYRGLQG